MTLSHPYNPPDLYLPAYTPNTYAFSSLIGYWLLFLLLTFLIYPFLALSPHRLPLSSKLTAHWFLTSGLIHLFFEGHFSLFHASLAARSDLFSQEWREYSHADSRYLVSDSFLVPMESVTAFAWGPACLWIVYAIWARRPERQALIALVSLGQLYGNVLYFGTARMEAWRSVRGEWLYLWVYLVGLNGVWIVVPNVVGWRAVREIVWAIGEVERRKGGRKEKQG